MEDVLEAYTRPYTPRQPLLCMDEIAKQLLRGTRTPQPPAGGRPARVGYQDERGVVVNCFLFCQPLRGQRWVDVTERQTKLDWAHQIRRLVDRALARRKPQDLSPSGETGFLLALALAAG